MLLISGVVGLAISCLSLRMLLRLTPKFGTLSRRDYHHTHSKAIPRIGGLALAAAFIGVEVMLWLVSPEGTTFGRIRLTIALSSIAMFSLGFFDDLRPLGAKRKLLGQTLIALAVWMAGIGINTLRMPFTEEPVALGPWGALVTVAWLVCMTNLINLIDGVDGLAGGICLILMALTAYVGQDGVDVSVFATGMTGALLGFLWYNFPPARIYLGDGGAYFLGFQIGLYSLVNSQKGTIAAALIAPLFVLALPIVDTGLAILRRGLRGLPVFRPDRRHLHHKLMGMGFSRRRVVLYIYALTLVFLVLALAAYWSQGKLVPVLLGIGITILLVCAGNLKFSREWFAVGRVVGNSLEMRKEVQYALSLTRWVSLDGARCKSVEELWSNLTLTAQKMGFSGVRLTIRGVTLDWTAREQPEAEIRKSTHDLGKQYGWLQLYAPANPLTVYPRTYSVAPTIADSNLYEILSDLLAEAWVKSASLWMEAHNEADLPFAGAVEPPHRMSQEPVSPVAEPHRRALGV